MASDKEYLAYILDRLSGLDGITYRPMMGEYIIYRNGKVVGGIYDDRFLLKPTKTALEILRAADADVVEELPYDGAKPMLLADADDTELTYRLIEAIEHDLPAKAPKKRSNTKR